MRRFCLIAEHFFDTGLFNSWKRFSKLSTLLPVDTVVEVEDLVMNSLKTTVMKLTPLTPGRIAMHKSASFHIGRRTRTIYLLRRKLNPDRNLRRAFNDLGLHCSF
jgi:hypothetical protein